MLSLNEIARALGGDVSGHSALVPGPGHSPADRSLSITPAENQDGFICHSFAGDDPIDCKDYIRGKLGLPEFKPNGKGNGNGTRHHPTEDEPETCRRL
jgi:putative DNA primase/helicase